MSDWSKETGIHIEGSADFTHALVVHSAPDWRTLLMVDAHGAIMMPDDLTIEEARSVIEQLVPLIPMPQRQKPQDADGRAAGER